MDVMESTDTPRSALDDIKTVSFKQGIRGYVVDEVDEFLDRAAAEVDQIREQMHQMRQQLRQASERIRQLEGGAASASPSVAPATVAVPVVPPAPVPLPPPAPPTLVSTTSHTVGAEQVTAMIAMAQQFIDHAQQEAETQARELTVAAQERAREIVAEARSRAEDEVTRLNGLKQRLSEDVTTLTRQLDTERARLSGILAELAQWIESSLHMGTTSGAHAAPPAPVQRSAPTTVAASPSAAVPPRPVSPPPAPPATIGQVLNFDPPSDDRA